jgi:pentose-5-phosphate-3-epimerase
MIDRIIAPAILATTFEDFKNSIQKIEHLFPYAHIDVMDGQFVKNTSFQDIEKNQNYLTPA